MTNSDLQNYITQSRQQGITDDKIRQSLIGQGWNSNDINQELGGNNLIPNQVQQSSPTTQPPKQEGSKSKWLLLLMGLGAALLLLAIFFMLKNSGTTPNNNSSATAPKTSSATNAGGGRPSTNKGACNSNTPYFSVPSDLPSTISLYPGSYGISATTLPFSTSKSYQINMCTNDDLEIVIGYLVGHNSGWALKDSYASMPPEQQQLVDRVPGTIGGKTNRILSGSQGQKSHMLINVNSTKGYVSISYTITL